MTRRGREIETLLLTMVAAVPLYFTQAIGPVPLILFHAAMIGIVVRVATGRTPEIIPEKMMRALGIVYVVFYVVDAAIISRSAIAASTHLVLFIAAYQPIESATRNNQAQRLLTTGLIFIAGLATSTSIAIVPFVILFAFLMFRQMIYVSHIETIRSTQASYALVPVSRAAIFYMLGTTAIGAAMFPMLPRLRNPVLQGFAGALSNATTGLSDSIDFNESRTSTPDPAVVARVWMGPEALPFFTPLRLRAAVYDRFSHNAWLQTRDEFRELRPRRGAFQIAKPVGFTRNARVQQQLIKNSRLFLPTGTYAVRGIPLLYEGPTRDAFVTFLGRGQVVTYEVSMARAIDPLRPRPPYVIPYPVTPAVDALARRITANATTNEEKAAAIENYLLRNFEYVQRPEQIGRTMNTDEFLLKVRKGHCEYFAAGMVALLSAENVPARIVGGFYGGRMNPLTGYFVLRREDAHAWVEVWDGSRWSTFDPTPASLRPGNAQAGLLRLYATALSDSVNYFWDRYVLTYGLGDQIALAAEVISRIRDTIDSAGAAMRRTGQMLASPAALMILGGILAATLTGFGLSLRQRSAFRMLAQHMQRLDIQVGAAMTMEEALTIARSKHPSAARDLEPLIALYDEEQFSTRPDPSRRRILRRRLAELKV